MIKKNTYENVVPALDGVSSAIDCAPINCNDIGQESDIRKKLNGGVDDILKIMEQKFLSHCAQYREIVSTPDLAVL